MNSEIMKKLEEKAKEQQLERERRLQKYISAAEVSKMGSIKAKIIRAEFREDRRGQECFFVTLQTPEGKLIVQKYTKMLIPYLYNSLRQFRKDENDNEIEYLINNYVTWRVEYYGRGYPRLYPTP